eukprot:13113222-Alexandrium_andersonii.AAC.1
MQGTGREGSDRGQMGGPQKGGSDVPNVRSRYVDKDIAFYTGDSLSAATPLKLRGLCSPILRPVGGPVITGAAAGPAKPC